MANTGDEVGSCYHGTARGAGSILPHACAGAAVGSGSRPGGSSGFPVAKVRPCLPTVGSRARCAHRTPRQATAPKPAGCSGSPGRCRGCRSARCLATSRSCNAAGSPLPVTQLKKSPKFSLKV